MPFTDNELTGSALAGMTAWQQFQPDLMSATCGKADVPLVSDAMQPGFRLSTRCCRSELDNATLAIYSKQPFGWA